MRHLRNDRLAGPSADAMPPVFNFTILRGPIFSHRLYLLRPFEYLVLDYVLESYMRTGMYGGAYAEPHTYAVCVYDVGGDV